MFLGVLQEGVSSLAIIIFVKPYQQRRLFRGFETNLANPFYLSHSSKPLFFL